MLALFLGTTLIIMLIGVTLVTTILGLSLPTTTLMGIPMAMLILIPKVLPLNLRACSRSLSLLKKLLIRM
jgi:hypothetical protein